MRSMIDTYDQYFGNGTGEAFFSGPYLDVLPTAVTSGRPSPKLTARLGRQGGGTSRLRCAETVKVR